MKKPRQVKQIFLTVSCVILIALSLMAIFSRRQTEFQELRPEGGVLDITAVDFSKEIYNIANWWDFYPGKLYTSQDIAAGAEKAAETNEKNPDYGTYRLRIHAQPNVYFTLCSYSVDYATRVFVNGTEVLNVGNVSDSAENSVPKIDYMSIPLYSGDSGEIELIYQYSNFVHKDGGSIPPTYIASPENMKHLNEGNDVTSLFFGSVLLFLSFYFLLNAATQRRVDYLCLAVCCLLMAFRDQNFFNIHLFPPTLTWQVVYRIFMMSVSLLPAAILLLLRSLYPKSGKRTVTAIYASFMAADALLHFILPTQALVFLCTASYYASSPYLVYLIFCVIRYYLKIRKFDGGDFLTIGGYIVLLAALIAEGLLTHIPFISRYGIAPYGMLVFVLLISIAINLRVQQREIALAESRRRAELLEQMNTMNKEFLHKVAHELKTPLTVISGYAQFTGMQLAKNATDSNTPDNLKTIQTEAQRLGNMVSKLMEYSYGKSSETVLGKVEISELFRSTAAICAPMCIKNNNLLLTDGADCPPVHGNFEMLLQICVNLIVNANKHTENGQITVTAGRDEKASGLVRFFVSDTGSGISPENIPRLFEKGFSADGGSGLGLTICREALEIHEGTIGLEKSDGNGTVFYFTVPMEGNEE